MSRLSDNCTALICFFTLIFSIPILYTGISLDYHAATDCERFLTTPLVAIGTLLMAASLAGLLGTLFRIPWLLWLYLLVTFLLVVLVLGFTVFAFVVTHKGPPTETDEYQLGDYSEWLQRRVEDPKNWAKIKSCLQDAKACKSSFLNNQYLSPTQSGCCKPPRECRFVYLNLTGWTTPAGSLSSSDPDCAAWKNDENALCYDCQSCKASFAANVRNDWKKVAIIDIVFVVFLITVYSIGCTTFRNVKWEDNAGQLWYNPRQRWRGYP